MPKLSSLLLAALLPVCVAACGASGGSDTKTADKTTTTAKRGSSPTTSSGETTTGGGTASGSEDEYTKALAKEFTSGNESGGDLVFSQKQAECVAPRWVKIIGVDKFKEKDVAPSDLENTQFNFTKLGLTKDQATEMIDGVGSCKVNLYQKLLDVLGKNLDSTQQKCLKQNLGPATARQVLVEALYQDDPSSGLAAELQKLDEKCKLTDTTSATANSAVPTTSTP